MSPLSILTGEVIEGELPVKALTMVREWLALHRDALREIWDTQEFRKLPPLE